MLSIIVATDENNGIGLKNKMPWHYPEDLAYFRKVTSGHTVIMGSKTFSSIGKALPKRKNLVVTRNQAFDCRESDIILISDPLAFFKENQDTEDEIFVIGGSAIYELAMPFISKIYLTKIAKAYEVDCYFPEIDGTKFQTISSEKQINLTFSILERVV